jgi:hypothetical protein
VFVGRHRTAHPRVIHARKDLGSGSARIAIDLGPHSPIYLPCLDAGAGVVPLMSHQDSVNRDNEKRRFP